MPSDSERRLLALRRTQLLDSPPEESFDRLARLAGRLLRAPVALVSLVDETRQFWKSASGLDGPLLEARGTPVGHSFCQFAVASRTALVVPDARVHPLVKDSPLVRDNRVIAYLGAPLFFDGEAIGTLCAIDHVPRDWTQDDVEVLTELARSVTTEIELRVAVRIASEQQALQAAMLENISDGVLAIDNERRILVMNAATRALFAPVRSAVGEPLPPEWASARGAVKLDGAPLEGSEGVLARALAGESTRELTFALQRSSGVVWIEAAGQPIRDERGEQLGAVGAYRDVSVRQTRQAELLRAQETLVRMGRIARVGGWELDVATGALRWSDEVYRIHDLPVGEASRLERAIDFYAPEARPIIAAAVEHGLRDGEPWDLELPMVTAKGRAIWVRAQGEAERVDGKVTRLFGAFQDITDRKRADAQLAEEREFLRAVLESLPNAAVLVLDKLGRVERSLGGPTFAPLEGSPETLLGQSLTVLAAGDEPGALHDAIGALAAGERRSVELTRDGRRFEVTLMPFGPLEEGRGLAVAYDVTERDQLRARLATQERLVTIGTLAAGVGHEINNPLSYVMTTLEVLQEEVRALAGPTPSARFEELFTLLAGARDGSERIRKIVRGLRAFARDERVIGPVSLSATLEVSLDMAMHELRPRCAVTLALDPVPPVVADEARLAQVLVNLLVNAAQAFGERPLAENVVTVTTRTDARGWGVVEVRDNGPGMDERTTARVFEPFFTTKRVGEGTGLGLAIAHGAVASLGGELVCETRLGQGTTFRVSLPPAPEPAPVTPKAAEPPSVPESRRGRVLVIDDDVAVTNSIARILRKAHDVTVINEPNAALATLLGGASFDVIFCDVMMPGLSGAELFARVKAALPEVASRFVFITGGVLYEETRRFFDEISNERVEKPFSVESLRATARRFVR